MKLFNGVWTHLLKTKNNKQTTTCKSGPSARSVISRVRYLCDPMDYSPIGSSVHGIFQARVLEWIAIAFSELKLLKETKSLSLSCLVVQ